MRLVQAMEKNYFENFYADTEMVELVMNASAAQPGNPMARSGAMPVHPLQMGMSPMAAGMPPNMFFPPAAFGRGGYPPPGMFRGRGGMRGAAGGMPPFMPPFNWAAAAAAAAAGGLPAAPMIVPPPPGVVPDSRPIREYVDLDAPAEEVVQLDYRTQVTYD
jgi:hypothetical protein